MDTRLTELADKFSSSSKKPNKHELNEFVKESLILINQVNDLYKKFFDKKINHDGTLGNSLLFTIENKINKLGELYDKYFIEIQENTGNNIITDIEKFTSEITEYHQKLLEGDLSIKADISHAQEQINDFYYYLFDKVVLEEGEMSTDDGMQEGDVRVEKIKKIIFDTNDFYSKLEGNNEEVGYKEAIESFYNYLYQKQDGKIINKVDKLKEDIKVIQTFRNSEYDNIVSEIKQAKRDAESLLNTATGGSLVEGYEQSKNEYKLTSKSFERIQDDSKNQVGKIARNIIKIIVYYFGQLIDYSLFIMPLIGLVLIFVNPTLLSEIIKIEVNLNNVGIGGRLLISLPLWWISLFGQRNISHRKRIAEEYNHKIQVLKTYLNFTTNQSQYPIDKNTKQALDKEVLEVIKRRPGDIYGKDESVIDKVIEFVKTSKSGQISNIIKEPQNNI